MERHHTPPEYAGVSVRVFNNMAACAMVYQQLITAPQEGVSREHLELGDNATLTVTTGIDGTYIELVFYRGRIFSGVSAHLVPGDEVIRIAQLQLDKVDRYLAA